MIQIPPTTVQAKNLPGTSISSSVDAEILGGPQVRFLEMIGKTQESIGDFMLARQDQIDMTTVMNAESEWAIAEDAKLTELLSRKGENAFDLLGEAEQWFDGYGVDPTQDKPGKSGQPSMGAAPGQISAGFREKRYNNMNERQQQYFDMAKNKRKAAFLRSVGTHENKERLASVIKSADSAIASHMASAIRNYNNPDQLQEDLKKIENTLKAKAAVSGLSTEELDREREVAKATIHEGILNQLLAAKDIPGATRYFTENMSELEGRAIPAMKAELRRQTVIEYGSNEASRILKLDQGVWNAELQAIPDAEIRKEARTNLYHMASWQEKAKRQAREDNQNKAYDLIWGEKRISDIKEIPEDIQKTLTYADRGTFRSMIRARDGEWPAVNPQTSATNRMSLDEMRDEDFLEEYTPTKFWNKLSRDDHNSMKARVEQINKTWFDDNYPSFMNAFDTRMGTIGWSKTNDTQRWNILKEEASKAYDNWKTQNPGLRPDRPAIQAILDGLTKSKDKSTSRVKELENQYPRVVSPVTTITRSQMLTDFKNSAISKKHWTKANEDALEGQLGTAMATWVFKEQRAGRGVSPQGYFDRVQLEGGNVVQFDGKDTLYGTLTEDQKAKAEVDVDVPNWFIDKTYNGKEIDDWITKNPDAAIEINKYMTANGIPATLANMATEVYRFENREEKEQEKSNLMEDIAAQEDKTITQQNQIRTNLENSEQQANKYKKDLAEQAMKIDEAEKQLASEEIAKKANAKKLKTLEDNLAKKTKEIEVLQQAEAARIKADKETKAKEKKEAERKKALKKHEMTQRGMQDQIDKVVKKQDEKIAKRVGRYKDMDWQFNNDVFTESLDLNDEEAYPDWFLKKKLEEVMKEAKKDGESPQHTEIMSLLVGTMDSRGIDY